MTTGRIVLIAALAMLVIWPPVIYLATRDNDEPATVTVCTQPTSTAGGVSPFDDC